MLISIETHITCDFSEGSGPPIPCLAPHMAMLGVIDIAHMQRVPTDTSTD